MNIYKEYVTKAKLPEYHLDYDLKQKDLIKELTDLNYKNYDDFKIINDRGYSTKAVIRLIKSKIKKDLKALEIIKKYLITEEKYYTLQFNKKMYYTQLEKLKSIKI